MTQTSKTDQSGVLPTGEEIYDMLMGSINPELLTANIPHLDEKHAGETEEERKARYERYQRDFAKYDAAFKEWTKKVDTVAAKLLKYALKSAEAKSREEEAGQLANLESQLVTAA